jgi:uncharacterized membrane protein
VEGRTAITINASPEAVYAAWREFERLASFMYHLKSVSTTSDGRSHWVARGPAGTSVEWDAEITDDIPAERIAWRSLDGASVDNAGSVQFRPAPGDQGTEVHLALRYSLPGGALSSAVAKLFGEEPTQQISDDLRRFKQIVETGEIARSDGSPLGSRTKNLMHQHDAHPLTDDEAAGAAQEAKA